MNINKPRLPKYTFIAVISGICTIFLPFVSLTSSAQSLENSRTEKIIRDDVSSFGERGSAPCKGSNCASGSITLDDRPIPRDQLIWDFAQIAFSSTLWLETVEDQSFLVRSRIHKGHGTTNSTDQTWLSPFINKSQAPARTGVINKWMAQEITVGVGWPSDIDQFFQHTPPDKPSREFINTVQAVTVGIAKESGLNLKFVHPDDPQENTESFARIRIVPIKSTGLHNKYKSYVVDASHTRHPRIQSYQTMIDNAVEFTPYSRSQVDGFFIPNENNQIEFAGCRIVSGLSPEMRSALVTECLLRSLGLPNTVQTYRFLPYRGSANHSFQMSRSSFFLGLWNQQEDASSKTIFHDGENALNITTHEPSVIFDEDKKIFRRVHTPIRPLPLGNEAVPSPLGESVKHSRITQYDAKLIRMLYCDAIKPGMDREMAIRALGTSTACGVNIDKN